MVDHFFGSMVLGAGVLFSGIFGGFGGGDGHQTETSSPGGFGGQHQEQTVGHYLGNGDNPGGGGSSDGSERAGAATTSRLTWHSHDVQFTTDAVVTCVKNAVVARESSIDAAEATQAAARSAALATRASALASAYTGTDINTIRITVQAAWSVFNKSTSSAQKTFQASQKSAVSTFRTAVKACNAPTAILGADGGMFGYMGMPGGGGNSENKPQPPVTRPMVGTGDGAPGNGGNQSGNSNTTSSGGSYPGYGGGSSSGNTSPSGGGSYPGH